MISILFNDADAWLLDDAPNWATSVAVAAELPVAYERGLSGRETRRPTGDTLRLAVKWSAHVAGRSALTTLRNSLQALTTEPVLCPFWPGITAAGEMPACVTAFYVLLDDAAAPAIAAAAAAPFARTSYPLLVGYLKTPPAPQLLTDELATVAFDFAEADESALTPPAFAAPAALADASGARPLFPFRSEWSQGDQSGGSDQDITRQQIGALRSLQVQYFTQRPRRVVKQNFVLETPLGLLRFFLDCGAETASFWLPAGISETALTADVAAADTALTVDEPAALGGNVFIALNDNEQVACLKVDGVSGNDWNLASAPGKDFIAANTRLETLLLARFDALKLSLSFLTPSLATATLQFKELPWEPAAVAGETIGITMGALPPTAMLYRFTLTIPSANQVWYFTNFERDLNDGDHAWISAPLENDDITETDNLERQSVTLKSRQFADNPLALLIPFQLEFPLLVEIFEGDVAGGDVANLRCYFAGEVGKCDVEPPFITAECSSMSSLFDRNLPRRLYQPNCNWVLFEPNCGLLPADWQWTAVVVSYDASASTLIIGTLASDNVAALDAHFFAGGYLSIVTAGKSQSRMIGDNTAPVGGQITVYLAQPLFTAPAIGDAVAVFPGCDAQPGTCLNKFNNFARFGGFPFMPVGNPSVLRISQNSGGGGKK